jgi:hypothetical protein
MIDPLTCVVGPMRHAVFSHLNLNPVARGCGDILGVFGRAVRAAAVHRPVDTGQVGQRVPTTLDDVFMSYTGTMIRDIEYPTSTLSSTQAQLCSSWRTRPVQGPILVRGN